MSEYRFSRFFGHITHAVMALLLIACLFIYRSMLELPLTDAVRIYHSYPYMIEHILLGLAVYLVFSVVITKIHRASLHDSSQSGQK